MTGEELTAMLMRHGIEVMEVSVSDVRRPFSAERAIVWRITTRDTHGVGDLEALLPHNVEMTLQSRVVRGIEPSRYLGDSSGYIGPSMSSTREVRVRGRNPDGLTSPPPTARQLGVVAMPDMRSMQRSQRPSTSVPEASRPTQEQSFRLDLYHRLTAVVGTEFRRSGARRSTPVANLRDFANVDRVGIHAHNWQWGWGTIVVTTEQEQQLLRRWSVYTALKSLYDVVDGVEGATSAAMPRDVEAEWNRRSDGGSMEEDYVLSKRDGRYIATNSLVSIGETDNRYGSTLQQMPSILDAVAFARVAAAETAQPQPATAPPVAPSIFRAGLPSVEDVAAHERLHGGLWESQRPWQRRVGNRPYPDATNRWHLVRMFDRVYHRLEGWGETICNPDQKEWREAMLRPILNDGTVVAWETLQTALLQSTIQGQRADLLIIDDIIEPPSTLTLDALTSRLPTLFPGGEPSITGVKQASGRDGVFTVSVQLGKVAGSTASAAAVASELPSNVVLAVTTQTGVQREFRGTCVSRLEAPAQRKQRYFTADGDTSTSPTDAPPWLHSLIKTTSAASATWRSSSRQFDLTFAFGYGCKLTREQINDAVRRIGDLKPEGRTISVSWTNAMAPPVTAETVRQLRSGVQLNTIISTLATYGGCAWAHVQPNVATMLLQVIDDIQSRGCQGLSDEAAVPRCQEYATCIEEAAKVGTPVAEYTEIYTMKWRTRFNLLDLDDGPVTPTVAAATLKRGTKPPTAAQVRKFRDAFEGRSSTSAAEAAKVANFGDDEVAQHLLVSWCGGLSDDEAVAMLTGPHREMFITTQPSLDTWAQRYRRQNAATLDPDSAADPSTTIAAWHAEQQRRHARAAELRIKTVQRVAEAAQQPSRWDLLELDGAVLPPADELRVKPAVRPAPRAVTASPWQPPAVTTQHIDVVLPAPIVDYVDVSMLPAEMHGAAVLSCLLDEASRRVGAVKGN